VAAVAVVLAIFAKSATTHATPAPPVSLVVNAVPSAPPVSAAPSVNNAPAPSVSVPVVQGSPIAAAEMDTKEVFLAAEPSDAKVTRDGKDVGALPTALHLKSGESVALVVSRTGYKTQTITLDGSQPRMLVKLERAAGKPRPAAARPAEPGAPAVGDFQDPFLKK
jgi:hypothetical protein